LVAVTKQAHTPVQWSTLAWIVGAAVAAAVIIAIIVIVSRRPKSMETGIAEFSRSLQAVAPSHRPAPRPSATGSAVGPGSHVKPSTGDRSVRAGRGETDGV
jgi:hypothetical protein